MRSVAVLAAVAVLAVTLAGCSSGDPERYPGGVTPSSSSHAPSSSSSYTWPPSSSSTSAAPVNRTEHAPVGVLKATLNGTAATFELNGTDEDGDALGWTLDFGDGNQTNGTALPSVQAHNYTLPANATSLNFTASFTLSDGLHNATFNATFPVNATRDLTVVTVSWTVGSFWCMSHQASAPDPAPSTYKHYTRAAGILFGELAVDPAWTGQPFTADFGLAASPVDQGVLTFYDAGDLLLASASSGMPPPPSAPSPPAVPDLPPFAMVVSGAVPDTAAFAVFANCGNPEGITATFTVG